MSSFQVWLRTDDQSKIPARRRLFIEEPRGGRRGRASEAPTALWYPIEITVLAPPVRDDALDSGNMPPPPPPPLRRLHRQRMKMLIAVMGVREGLRSAGVRAERWTGR